MSQPGGGSEEFYSNGSKRARSAGGHSSDWFVVRLSRSQHHRPSGSNRSGVYVLVGSTQLTSPTWWGLQCLQNSSKVLLCVSLEGEPGPCPKAALLFLLTAPPLSPGPLPSRISICLNLQGRSWRLNEAYFLLSRNGGHRKAFVPRSPTGPCSVSVSSMNSSL